MTTTTELEAYAKGFKDGWETARKEFEPGWGRNKNHLQPHMWKDLKIDPPPGTSYFKCPVCGAFGTTGVVCYNHNCPSKVTSGAIGAGTPPTNVGVGGIGTTVPGTVGSTGGFAGGGMK